jgi:hypothetical protein
MTAAMAFTTTPLRPGVATSVRLSSPARTHAWDPRRGTMLIVVPDQTAADDALAILRRTRGVRPGAEVTSGADVLRDHRKHVRDIRSLHGRWHRMLEHPDDVDRYLAFAREGRTFVWVEVDDRETASRTIGLLADAPVLHLTYYGRTIEHVHLVDPTLRTTEVLAS